MSNEMMAPKDIADLPSDKNDRDKIRQSVREIADCLTRIESEKALIGEIQEHMKDEYGLSKRLCNMLARAFNDGDFNEKLETMESQTEEFSEFFTGVMEEGAVVANQ